MMKKIFFGLSVILVVNGFSQGIIDSGKLLQGGVDDGVKMVDAYLTPLNKSLMVATQNADFHTLYKDGDKRIAISLEASFITIPKADLTFDVNALQLENLAAEPGHSMAQTVFGAEDSITIYSRDSIPKTNSSGGGNGGFPFRTANLIDSVAAFSFSSVPGIDLGTLPLPNIGFTYKFNFGNLSTNVLPYFTSKTSFIIWNISWKQNISRFIDVLKSNHILVSSKVGYTHTYIGNVLDVKPGGVYIPYSLTGEATGPYDNQRIKMNYSQIYLDLMAEYSLKQFTFWGGLGYNVGFSSVKILGTYPIYASDPTGNTSVSVTDIHDPMDLNGSFSRFKGVLGIRYDISRYYAQLNYTIASYGGLGFGLGVLF